MARNPSKPGLRASRRNEQQILQLRGRMRLCRTRPVCGTGAFMPIADLFRKVIAAGDARDASTIRAKRLRGAKT
jgi:hypothetical protein